MITVGRNTGSQPFYNMGTYVCDYESDVSDLPTHKSAGSKATVIESGNVYILNSYGVWKKQPVSSNSSSSSSGSNSGGGTSNDESYDGGNLDLGDDTSYDGGDMDNSSNSGTENSNSSSGNDYDGGNLD